MPNQKPSSPLRLGGFLFDGSDLKLGTQLTPATLAPWTIFRSGAKVLALTYFALQANKKPQLRLFVVNARSTS